MVLNTSSCSVCRRRMCAIIVIIRANVHYTSSSFVVAPLHSEASSLSTIPVPNLHVLFYSQRSSHSTHRAEPGSTERTNSHGYRFRARCIQPRTPHLEPAASSSVVWSVGRSVVIEMNSSSAKANWCVYQLSFCRKPIPGGPQPKCA